MDKADSNLVASGYKEPLWSGICINSEYSLDVLKDGVIINNIKLNDKPFHLIGRFKTCDLIFEHPSLSRFHAVLQYCATENDESRDRGWYIMDLESTHGTIINKIKINPLTYVRIRSGYVIKFGGSSRLYIVNGPEDDKDPLSQHSWTELNEMKEKAKNKLPVITDSNSGGCMWGMDNDSDEDESCFNDPKVVDKHPHEKLYKEDPKKVIKWYFDREGIDEGPMYNFSNNGFNRSTCTLELPVYGENGYRLIAEVSGSEKKKDMVEKCAFQACCMLDEIDELYKSEGSSVVPRKDLNYYKEKDYYSSEEDEFYDRTGDLEHKRLRRMRRFGVIEDTIVVPEKKVEAKDSDCALVKLQRLEEINNEIVSIEQQLEEARRATEADKDASEMDEIEKYIAAIQSGTLNRQSRLKLKAKLFELQREENLLRKQLKLSIPVTDTMRKTLFSNAAPKEKRTVDDVVMKDDQSEQIQNESLTTDNRSGDVVVRNIAKCENDCEEEEVDGSSKVEEGDIEKKTYISEYSAVSMNEIPDNGGGGEDRGDRKRPADSNHTDKEVQKKVVKQVEEEDVSDWLPPQGQSGDGRTSLNDQLGY